MRPSAAMYAPVVIVIAAAALGCRTQSPPAADTAVAAVATVTAAEPWYRRSAALDLTGDGQPDSVRLEAVGTRPDSLKIVLRLFVNAEEKHREEWGSSYEIALIDSTVRGTPRETELLRARLDTVLARVKVERLDDSGVRLMAEDSVLLAKIVPRPTHRVSIAYGYETTVRLVWDAPRQRFVRLWSCC